ncbi:uncharacterized protein ColSpa_09277 [Colletotrichum spaethianum]|uniref:Uncharacterized protein n=1 Tax=Colletotrichum spaethianum TaxID=700344 RepID=A0AA37UJY9_9PEZI|nr:uncharacterized protein ColSpa_09277 [Colletotrichum spaethianum]GKT49096.1 hypothetical protein ColSpa_09277 [Colletotrichum spaethianum]
MRSKYLTTAAFAASAAAQQEGTITSCEALSCINPESRGVCAIDDSPRVIGVGIAADVVNISSSSLSYTLVDGTADGILASEPGYQFSTQTLYVGVPSDFETSGQSAGCALMMQYQAQTFNMSETRNTTSCEGALSDSCQENLADVVRQFEYSSGRGQNSTTGSTLSRCESLAQFVNTNIHQQLSLCGLYAGFVNTTGGSIVGPDVSSSSIQLQNEGCQPVVPQEYELHHVAEMRQILPTGENNPGLAGGRSGVTPVLSVLYEDEDDRSPDVQLVCLRTYTSDGQEMPDTINNDENRGESGATTSAPGTLSVAVAGLLGFAALMI